MGGGRVSPPFAAGCADAAALLYHLLQSLNHAFIHARQFPFMEETQHLRDAPVRGPHSRNAIDCSTEMFHYCQRKQKCQTPLAKTFKGGELSPRQ